MNNAAATITPETTLGEVMTTEPVTIRPDDRLSLVDNLLTRFAIRHFPVLENNQLAGVICRADLLLASATSISPYRTGSMREALNGFTSTIGAAVSAAAPEDLCSSVIA